jgi:hypothetical protein
MGLQTTTHVERLRLLADFCEQHPDLPQYMMLSAVVWASTKEEALQVARLPGARKRYDETELWIDVPLADDFKVEFFTSRNQVCTAKKIEEVVVPAQPERKIKKVVEWECHPLLQADAHNETATNDDGGTNGTTNFKQ